MVDCGSLNKKILSTPKFHRQPIDSPGSIFINDENRKVAQPGCKAQDRFGTIRPVEVRTGGEKNLRQPRSFRQAASVFESPKIQGLHINSKLH